MKTYIYIYMQTIIPNRHSKSRISFKKFVILSVLFILILVDFTLLSYIHYLCEDSLTYAFGWSALLCEKLDFVAPPL
jgi:hypothetical protein